MIIALKRMKTVQNVSILLVKKRPVNALGATLGRIDATNVSSKLREGWEPVKATDHPEITMVTVEQEKFKDNVVIGGLMLCKAPEEMVGERNDYFAQQSKAQIASVDNNLMRENDPRMPLFNDRKSKVTFGNGT